MKKGTGVEAHFMQSQDAQNDAELLKASSAAQQMINKAIKNFIAMCGRNAAKADKRWNKEPKAERTWPKFEVFWKTEMGLQAEVQTLRKTVATLQCKSANQSRHKRLALQSVQLQ